MFIAEMEKLDNFKVLFRKKDKADVCLQLSLCPFWLIEFQNTSRESKNSLFKHIGQVIWPEYAAIDVTGIGTRMKNKYDMYVPQSDHQHH